MLHHKVGTYYLCKIPHVYITRGGGLLNIQGACLGDKSPPQSGPYLLLILWKGGGGGEGGSGGYSSIYSFLDVYYFLGSKKASKSDSDSAV